MDKQQLEAIRARDADDYAAVDVLRNIRSAGNTDPELEATINMIADRRALLAAYDALRSRLAEAEFDLKNASEAMRRYARDALRLKEAEALLRVMPGYGLSAYDKERWEKARNAFLAADSASWEGEK